MPNTDSSLLEPDHPARDGNPAHATTNRKDTTMPNTGPSLLDHGQRLADRLHQVLGELFTCQHQPDAATRVAAIATSLVTDLMLATSDGSSPGLAYRTALQATARRYAAQNAVPCDPHRTEEVFYRQWFGATAAATIAELLNEAHQTPGMDPMQILTAAHEAFADLAMNADQD